MQTSAKIRLRRAAVGMSQRDLAERSGIPFSTLVKIEQGVIPEPKLVDVIAIAAVIGGTCVDYAPDDTPEPEPAGRGRPKPKSRPSVSSSPPLEAGLPAEPAEQPKRKRKPKGES